MFFPPILLHIVNINELKAINPAFCASYCENLQKVLPSFQEKTLPIGFLLSRPLLPYLRALPLWQKRETDTHKKQFLS